MTTLITLVRAVLGSAGVGVIVSLIKYAFYTPPLPGYSPLLFINKKIWLWAADQGGLWIIHAVSFEHKAATEQ